MTEFKPRDLETCVCGHNKCYHEVCLPKFWKRHYQWDGRCERCTCNDFTEVKVK